MIVYVETEYLVGVATGRELASEQLLHSLPSGTRLGLPAVCVMECLKWVERERGRRKGFAESLDLQISQLRRDLTSDHATALLRHLEQSKIADAGLLNDIEDRLFSSLRQLRDVAELVELTAEAMSTGLDNPVIGEPSDNLILFTIVAHARAHGQEAKVFLSGNERDFGAPEVQRLLLEAGVARYFSSTTALLGWAQHTA